VLQIIEPPMNVKSAGVVFMNLHFSQKVFGQIFIFELQKKIHSKTTDEN
jgi:hypothetical protein